MKVSIYHILPLAILAWLSQGCNLVGLDLQENAKHEQYFAKGDLQMTAWEFLNQPRQDTLFNRMLEAIEYAGLQDEYAKPARTFVLLVNNALYRTNNNGNINANCFFARYVTGKKPLDWTLVPREDVRNLLLYHIVEGEYGYDNLGPDPVEVQTLSPEEGKNQMYLHIANNRDSKLMINGFPGSGRTIEARTADLQATNGRVHVFDLFAEYVTQ